MRLINIFFSFINITRHYDISHVPVKSLFTVTHTAITKQKNIQMCSFNCFNISIKKYNFLSTNVLLFKSYYIVDFCIWNKSVLAQFVPIKQLPQLSEVKLMNFSILFLII